MSSPVSHRVWHVIYSGCVRALSALTFSTLVVAAQPVPHIAAQPEAAAPSPAETLAYLHAQVPVEGFYLKRGFHPVGGVFEEAGIPHRKMELAL